jgi:phosphohistidine phosphatase
MRLYLIRHGHSPSAKEAGVASDFERPLSQQGRKSAQEASLYLKQSEIPPKIILHSPLKRTLETALEINSVLDCPFGLKVFEPLANIIPASDLYKELEPLLEKYDSVALVGHQPQLGDMAALLCERLFDIQLAQMIALDLVGKSPALFLWSRDAQGHISQ